MILNKIPLISLNLNHDNETLLKDTLVYLFKTDKPFLYSSKIKTIISFSKYPQ